MPRSLTQEEFTEKALAVCKPHYDLSKVTYVSAKTKIEVVCKLGHGSFFVTPNNFLSGKGCPACANVIRGSNERARRSETFLADCIAVHINTYGLDKVNYRGFDTPITVTCKEHEDFEILPGNFLKGKGCQKCGNRQRGVSNRLSQEEFVSGVTSANTMLKPVDSTIYTSYECQVDFSCTEHGLFSAAAKTLLGGKGCPGCTSYGFNVAKPAKLYILTLDKLVKVGITNRDVFERVSSINTSIGQEFNIVEEFSFDKGRIAKEVESCLLRELRSTHKQPTEKFDGSTECFYDVDIQALLNRIEELIEEHSYAPNRLVDTHREAAL
jgi:Zn finger protein HypA/HybF involved in hydrogenase expression